MADYDEHSNSNSIILRLMELILAMNDEQRLDLLNKLEELPSEDLSLGDRNDVRKGFEKNISFSVQDRKLQGHLQGYQQRRTLHPDERSIYRGPGGRT